MRDTPPQCEQMSKLRGHAIKYSAHDDADAAEPAIKLLHDHAREQLGPGEYYEIRRIPAGLGDYGRGPWLMAGVAWVQDPSEPERECPTEPVWGDWRGYWLHWTGRTPDA